MTDQLPSDPQYHELETVESSRKKDSLERVETNFQKKPIQTLVGKDAEVYCKLLEGLIVGGKPNSSFPSGRSIANLIYLLRPSVNRGLSDKVRVNLGNGLPDEPDIGRVIADKEICKKILHSHDHASVRSRQDDASKRLQARLDYYLEVDKRDLPERFQLDLKLKRVNEQENTADFIAVFERFDPGEGVFTKYNIHLRHKSERWSKPKVELKGDDLRYTEEFRNVISRYSSDEAEFAFILLSNVPGITVHEVSRGRVGPVWMDGVPCPKEIEELLAKHPGNVILNFPFEKVVVPEVEGKEDNNRDPFSRLYRNSLDPENKEFADARASKLGYIVHKERKFCCSRAILAPLRKLCSEAGRPCIIYPGR